nr:hypothetical protein [Rhodococcus sp. 15-649-1-2]
MYRSPYNDDRPTREEAERDLHEDTHYRRTPPPTYPPGSDPWALPDTPARTHYDDEVPF